MLDVLTKEMRRTELTCENEQQRHLLLQMSDLSQCQDRKHFASTLEQSLEQRRRHS